MKSHRVHMVDVFAEHAFSGNQLAVVLDAEDIDPGQMQKIAKEMNLSETTFVLPPADAAHAARVRIFTPAVELPFAGHPTIGTAWVMHTEGLVPGGASEFVLEEPVGPVPVRGVSGTGGTKFWLTNPELSFGDVFSERAAVAAAIGLTEEHLMPDVPIQVVTTGNPLFFVALNDASAVDRARPDIGKLAALFQGRQPLPAYLFARAGAGRLYSRMFGGHVLGIPEDPATGAAAGPLGAFAVRYGLVPRGPEVSIVSEQGTQMGRQSFMYIELTYVPGSDLPARIDVGGSVRPVLSGSLTNLVG
ncbi:MAG: PhzF family phenazine biosynthesis protein [Candidatus Dormibacterales bacterium]